MELVTLCRIFLESMSGLAVKIYVVITIRALAFREDK